MICHNCKKEIGGAGTCPYCHAEAFKQSMPHHLSAGTIVGGRYKIEGVLGEGGFGITYLGRDNRLGHEIAVKEYFPHGVTYRNSTVGTELYISSEAANKQFEHGKKRFLDEAKILARFSAEPGVVSVTDFVEENNTAYLIMEYLDGETLQQYLKKRGKLSADEALSMLEPVMKTLEKIHAAGVIHRDISPDNIMVLSGGQVKLMDFGAAKDFVDDQRSMSVMLKQGYAPVEQYRRNGKQGPWTDVYALCATIYRCITGTTPEESLDRYAQDELIPPSEAGADISPALESVLLYGLAVRQEDRCQNIPALLGLIRQAKSGQSAPVRPDRNATIYADDPVLSGNRTIFAEDQVQAPERKVYGASGRPAPQRQYPQSDMPLRAPQPDIQPAPEKNKKRTATIAIGITAAVLIILTAVGIYMINRNTDQNKDEEKNDEEIVTAAEKSRTAISAGSHHTVGLRSNGTVAVAGVNKYGQCSVEDWTDIVSVSAGYYHTVGVKSDGTVVATKVLNGGEELGQCDVGDWKDIVTASAGSGHTVGLKKDGTVVATGDNAGGQCDVGDWTDIVAVAAGGDHSVGLKKDGTVVAVGKNEHNQCDVGDWTDIVAVSAGFEHTIGLKKDGTVVAAGDNAYDQCSVEDWTDIVAIGTGTYHSLGVKSDGTVISTQINNDENDYGQTEVEDWTDIVAVSANFYHSVGLRSDGTVLSTTIHNDEYNNRGQTYVVDWILKQVK